MRAEDKTKEELIHELDGLRKDAANLRAGVGALEGRYAQAVMDSVQDPITVLDAQCRVQFMNKAARKFLVGDSCIISPVTCHILCHHLDLPCTTYDNHPDCPVEAVMATGESVVVEHEHFRADGEKRIVEISASPLRDDKGSISGDIKISHDITERKHDEAEREGLLSELREALSKIKTLKGLLPICAWCRKIRDDNGYWKQVELFIEEHSDAIFSHGICPECQAQMDSEISDTTE